MILIAYDGSPSADRAVEEAARLFPGAEAIVLTVWHSVQDSADAARIALPDELVREAVEHLDTAAEEAALRVATQAADAASKAGLRAAPDAKPSKDSVWRTILAAADERDATAVVVGSRGRSNFKSALLGSVSDAVVHHSDRTVVVAPAA